MKSEKDLKTGSTVISHKTDRAHITITLKCNNNCLFCLQGHHPSEKHKNFESIKNEIREALKSNVNKIILSGGEPTIHPDIIKIIRFCKINEIRPVKNVQIISNGRMFSNESFTNACIKAGLTEATLSFHGHTKKIHDYLTQSKSFEQLKKAVKILKKNKILISIDVGIFKQNYKYLPEMIKFITDDLNITGDIDLMGPTLAGNAIVNFNDIMPKYSDVEPYLKKALEICRKKKLVCWVLRAPIKYMEGYEIYKQDTTKLVEMSISMNDDMSSIPPACEGIKCEYCRLESTCKALKSIFKKASENNIENGIRIIIPNKNINEKNIRILNEIKNIKEIIISGKTDKNGLKLIRSYFPEAGTIIKNPKDNFNFSDVYKKTIFEFDMPNIIKENNIIKKIENQIDIPKTICEQTRINILITKSTLPNLVHIIKKYYDKGIKRFSFSALNPYDFAQREISWHKGMSIKDNFNIASNYDYLPKYLERATSLCKDLKISYTMRNFPYCIFSDEFIKNNHFETDWFLDTINIKGIKAQDQLNFYEYVKFIYDTLHKERIKECENCTYKNRCAGFYDMHLKLFSKKR